MAKCTTAHKYYISFWKKSVYIKLHEIQFTYLEDIKMKDSAKPGSV